MIIYNIRNNGPYEFDKWILNIGQIHNFVYDTKEKYAGHDIHIQLKELNVQIKNICAENSWLNKLALKSRKRNRA